MKIKITLPDKNLSFQESVLKNRNMTMSELMRNMSSVESPDKMLNAGKAANRIATAIQNEEKIVLYTDYDADGFGCGVVFTELMWKLPYKNFGVFFNTRSMGFGMNKMGIDKIIQKHPDVSLIITSDNGIESFDATEYAISKGIDVIITDHHLPDASGNLPNAYTVVDPHQSGETCEFQDFCGTGVIYKVICMVYYLLCADTKPLNDVLDIVAVATIADVVPLRGENRIFAKVGLSKMSQECRSQWAAFKSLGSKYAPLVSFTSKDIGYFVGPCINACSRLNGDIKEPLTAFLKRMTEEQVHAAVYGLVQVNETRKEIQKCRREAAFAALEGNTDSFIVIAMDECEEGVVGLVAGDVCHKFYRPTVVLAREENGHWKGSGRGIIGLHMKEMLDTINQKDPSILLGYGGHAQACGLTVRDGKLDDFCRMANDLCAKAEISDPDLFVKKINVDYVIEDLTMLPRYYAQKVSMEPYGNSFEEPVVMVVFKPDNVKVVKEGKHLIFQKDGAEIISWNSGHLLQGRDPKTITEVRAIGTIDKSNALNCDPDLLELTFSLNNVGL